MSALNKNNRNTAAGVLIRTPYRGDRLGVVLVEVPQHLRQVVGAHAHALVSRLELRKHLGRVDSQQAHLHTDRQPKQELVRLPADGTAVAASFLRTEEEALGIPRQSGKGKGWGEQWAVATSA
jgi:hypothetical protein